MERIIYRINLDAHRTGIQRTLQGVETGDRLSRRVAISLVASGEPFEIPEDNTVATMYVTNPNSSVPDIHECTIENNQVIYDMQPATVPGRILMQLKLIETNSGMAEKVLMAPKFAVEVNESGVNDEGVEGSVQFTALEKALAQAKLYYDSRILNIEFDEEYVFRVFYADGTIYENTDFVVMKDQYDTRLLRVEFDDFVFRAYYADGSIYENTEFVFLKKLGIKSIEQIEAPEGDEAVNVIKVTTTSDDEYTFTVRNGSRGPVGPKPEKGVDYWNDEDKQEVWDYIDENMGTFLDLVNGEVI